MKKALVLGLLVMLLFSGLAMLSPGAHAASTTWTQKKIVLVWDGIYDNSTLSSTYKNQLNYIYYWLQERGIPFEKIYATQITWSMVNDTANYTYYIIPIMQGSVCSALKTNLTASHLLTSEGRYGIINYYWWTSEDSLPDGEPDSDTRGVYVSELNVGGTIIHVNTNEGMKASPTNDGAAVTAYATDADTGYVAVYTYRGNFFSHLGYLYLGTDISLNLLFSKILHFATYAVPFVVGIDDTTDEANWYVMNDGTKQTLTYNDLNNLSNVLRKYGFKANLILITDNVSVDGAVVKAANANSDVLFISLHQTNTSYDFGHSCSYETIQTRYMAAYNRIQQMHFNSNVVKDFKSWILPSAQYNDNTSHFAEDHGIRYFVADVWGIKSSWKEGWYIMSAVRRANKNGNNLPWVDTSYSVYVVPRSYTMPFGSPVSNESQVEKWWQDSYGVTHDLQYSINAYLDKAVDLYLLRGDLYFHAYSFTNGEIAQQYLDAVGQFKKAEGAATIGTTMTEHNDFAFARQTSTVTFSYAPHKVRIQINNNGPYTFPYYIAVPKSLLGSLSSTEHYALSQTRSSSAEIVKTDSNYVYVKITVPSLSSADFYVYIVDALQEYINTAYSIVPVMFALVIVILLFSVIGGMMKAATKGFKGGRGARH